MGGLGRLFGRVRVAVPQSLEIDGRSVPVAIRRHASARRIILRISPCGEFLKLTVPGHTPARTILAFLDRNRQWARERLSARPARLSVAEGAVIPFRGERLAIAGGSGRGTVLVPATGSDPARLMVGGDPAHLQRRVRDFVQREARRDLEAAVARHSAAVGIRPAGMALKDTTSRWGSCSSGRRLSFSWRIVLAPPSVLDYLAAHEVAHLREMNHGPDFWALCRELCPGMDEGRTWLRQQGGALHAIDFG